MKEIAINGETFMYRVCWQMNEHYDYEWTEFFKEVKFTYRKKFFLFGKRIRIDKPQVLFTVAFSIEDHTITKEEVHDKLERAIALLRRKEEIERGEII